MLAVWLFLTRVTGEVKYYKCDVTDPAAIAEVAKKVRAEVGR